MALYKCGKCSFKAGSSSELSNHARLAHQAELAKKQLEKEIITSEKSSHSNLWFWILIIVMLVLIVIFFFYPKLLPFLRR